MINKVKILLIEDSSEHIDLITILSSRYGYQIKIGKNLADFKRLLNNCEYDLILCDLDLQYHLEGLDILKFFKKSKLTTQIYAYTSHSAEDTFFSEQGFHGVIKKNFNELKELFDQLQVVMKPYPITNTICA